MSVAGLFNVSPKKANSDVLNDIAVLIPAYKEDAVIIKTTENVLKQSYPKEKFQIYVIADRLIPETINRLRDLPIHLIEVHFENSTKVKALNMAFQTIERPFDIGLVLDADNHPETGFLEKVNQYFNSGYLSIQGQRKPKNIDAQMSFLDGLSEAVNNQIVRKGTCNLGGSSAIVGSGFAVKYGLLKSVLAKMKSVGGFDKELEIELIKEGVKTRYFKDLILFDEKVANTKDFKNQRKRWIASQFFYLRKYFNESLKSLFKGHLVLFNSAFLRYAQLPRFINMVLLTFVATLFILLNTFSIVDWWVWLFIFMMMLLSILLAIPGSYYSFRLVQAIFRLPKTFLVMFLLLLNLKGANKSFIHTPHSNDKNKK